MELNLSKRLEVRPLKEGQTKTFKLCAAGRFDPHVTDARTGRPIQAFNGGATFEGYLTIYDPFETDKRNAKKILKNVTGSATRIVEENGKKKEVLDEVVSPIEFNQKGVCVVKHDQYNTLVCLTRANENASNPYRDKSKPALWEEVDVNSEVALKSIISDADLAYEAETIARKGDVVVLNAMSKKLLGKTFADPDDLRFAMVNAARSNPKEFIRTSKDKEMKMKVQIDDAMKMRFLDLNENEEWIWRENNGTDITLVKVDVSKDPYAALIEYILANKDFATKLSKHVDEQLETPVAV